MLIYVGVLLHICNGICWFFIFSVVCPSRVPIQLGRMVELLEYQNLGDLPDSVAMYPESHFLMG